jgi:hypothetical protein
LAGPIFIPGGEESRWSGVLCSHETSDNSTHIPSPDRPCQRGARRIGQRDTSSSAATVAFHHAGALGTRGAHAADAGTDQRIARDALWRRSDFPAGWAQTGPPATIGTSHCRTVDGAKAVATARVISPDFTHTAGASVETADDGLYLDPDAATAQRSFAALTSHGTLACLAHLVRRALVDSTRGQGVKVDRVETRSLTNPPVGDQSAASRILVRVFGTRNEADSGGGCGLRPSRPRIEIFSLARVGGPFDPTLELQLVRTGVGRLSDDLGAGS